MNRDAFRLIVSRLRRAGVPDKRIASLLPMHYPTFKVRLSQDRSAGFSYPGPALASTRRQEAMRALLAAMQSGQCLSPDDAVFVVADTDTPEETRATLAQLTHQRLIRSCDVAWLLAHLDAQPLDVKLAA